ncbi:uncharacterized protein LOC121112138 [Gallus gallus]|uniref:uncharacterized protein LOC121112138 n=1 Tax=Gallus gallus TaxID=9031 RepID=UPI001AE50082|nr:uncharacterized protein LOC121112138 [Gallus gallus]
MRQCRAAGLTGLATVLLVAVSRAQVQQEPSAETSEGTGVNITCSHPNIRSNDNIYWYRQLPGRGPAFLVSAFKGSKELPDPAGQVSVSADRRSSALLIAQPRHGDAAVYYCAVGTRGVEPRLRPGTNRFGRGGGTVPSGPAGGAADYSLPAPPEPALLTWNMSLALLGILRSKACQLHTFLSTACRGHSHLQTVPAVAIL